MKIGVLIEHAGRPDPMTGRPTTEYLDYAMSARQNFERRRETRRIINGLRKEWADFFEARNEWFTANGITNSISPKDADKWVAFQDWVNEAYNAESETKVTPCVAPQELVEGSAMADDALIIMGLMLDPDAKKEEPNGADTRKD